MAFPDWLQQSWFDLVQSFFILAGFTVTIITLRRDHKSRRVSNRLAITQAHREIWSLRYERPELSRIFESDIDLSRKPVTDDEALFLTFVILHFSSAFEAIEDDLVLQPDGLGKDIRWFFNLPIPKTVWDKSRNFQNERFVAFVEKHLG